jgi:hypothetical protein
MITRYYKYLTKLVEKKLLNDNEKLLIFTHKIPNFDVVKYPGFKDKLNIAK